MMRAGMVAHLPAEGKAGYARVSLPLVIPGRAKAVHPIKFVDAVSRPRRDGGASAP